MSKKNKTLKIILAILVVILISLISFGGIFVKDKNRMKNLLPEYQLGNDFNGSRVFTIKPDSTVNTEYYDSEGNKVEESSIQEDKKSEYTKKEIPINSEEVLNKENYEKTKEIIRKRLELSGVKEFEIRENEENGEMYISIPENSYSDTIVSQMSVTGNFKITDSEDTSNILIDGDKIKDVKVGYGTQSTGNVVYINIQFNKEGTEKLQEISKTYVTTTDEEGNETKKQISLILDDETLLSTYFSEEIKDGLLQLTMGGTSSTATSKDLQDSLTQASNLAVLLKTENLPITYKIDKNLYIQSEFNAETVRSFIIIGIVVLAILIIYAIIKYKKAGLLPMIGLVRIHCNIVNYSKICKCSINNIRSSCNCIKHYHELLIYYDDIKIKKNTRKSV